MVPLRSNALVLGTLLGVVTLACDGDKMTGPRIEPRPAILEFHSDPIRISVPDTVAVGSPFTISIRSYGGGCISEGHTGVVVEGLMATVRPVDRVRTGPNVVCTRELRLFEHVATVRFDEPGRATVRVVGRRQPGDEPLSVDRTVVVR